MTAMLAHSTRLVALCSGLLIVAAQVAGAPEQGPLLVCDSPLGMVDGRAGLPGAALLLDAGAYQRLRSVDEVVLNNFVLSEERRVSVALESIDPFAEDAVIVARTPAGEVRLPRPDVLSFGGQVAGHPDSRVLLSVSPHGNNGYVRLGDETFIISSGRSAQTMVYNPATLPPGTIKLKETTCHSDELVAPWMEHTTWSVAAEPPVDQQPLPDPPPCRMVDLAIETDWEFTGSLFGGDTGASAAYATALIAAVSEIYTRDFNTRVQICYLRVWSDSNDPWDGEHVGDQRVQFVNYWNANMTWVERDLVHFLSGRALGGGVARLGAICLFEEDYALSADMMGFFPYPIQHNHYQNWDLMVVAHETGHNFGARHTHDLEPPIDNCNTGDCSITPNATIMSYCHLCPGGLANVRMEFHPRMIDEDIMPYLATGPTCDISVEEVSISAHPTGQTVNVGDPVTFAVTAGGAEPLDYQWRNEGVDISGAVGATYPISLAIPADAGSYDVVVTNTCGSQISDPGSLTVLGLPGDYDGNYTVDLNDYTFFAECLFGPGVLPSPAQPPTVAACLGTFDFNEDTDVDLQDYQAFQLALPD